MRTVLATLGAAAAAVVVAAAAFVYSGVYNVAATDPHWPVTVWLLETVRTRSIQAHAAGLSPPAGYDEQARIVGAVSHFTEHCAVCHGGPASRRGELADGMYPQPPDLTKVASRLTPGELFWILKNGIKMSGMPSMANDGDAMLWSTVGLLTKLPGMSAEEFNDLWMLSQMQAQHGGMDHGSMRMEHGSVHEEPSPGE